MKKVPLFSFFIASALLMLQANAQTLCEAVKDGVLLAQDDKNTFLGKIGNTYDSESIFNEYGTYGSQYSSSSVWNSYGSFGSEHGSYSATNSYTPTPPMIIKNTKIVAYLSANKNLKSAIAPNMLKALCKEKL
jgi:hypothetical protein